MPALYPIVAMDESISLPIAVFTMMSVLIGGGVVALPYCMIISGIPFGKRF